MDIFICKVLETPLGKIKYKATLPLCILLIILQVTAFIIVPQTPLLTGVSVGIIVVCFVFFYILTLLGQRLMETIEEVKVYVIHYTVYVFLRVYICTASLAEGII